MYDLVTRVCYRERYGSPTLQDETEVKKKSVLWNSQEECTVFCTGKHNICHMKDNLCLLCIFPREFECYWKLLMSPTVFVLMNFVNLVLTIFIVTQPEWV
jgi:hypothetical protein